MSETEANPPFSPADVLVEQRRRWQAGERVLVESFLKRQPALIACAEVVLDLIANEQVLRRENGEKPLMEEYLARFPHWAEEIRRQFEVQEERNPVPVVREPTGSREHSATPIVAEEPCLPRAAVGPSIPGYKILELLGRGGQSVVHKARHLGLNRFVAVKMILGGENAREEDRSRFRREAEAVAHLQHPNIAQIYDVGEQNGLPYLALEYIAGGTLAKKLAKVPQPVLFSAQMAETLARTIHTAHQAGIVHRDLKPANVLLQADGTPKIIDFGLAKRLEVDATVTHTGLNIMGTPSYMAPEQAAGQSKHVGPAADIYALGVILYEMLTGRAPFTGETSWDVLAQVRSDDPVPPRRLQPRVPIDLETICLKCLSKNPSSRYDNAQNLADDLLRFRSGQPIVARPVGVTERAIKWMKRRPTVAMLSGAVIAAVVTGVVASLALAAWAIRERNVARNRLDDVQRSEWLRVQTQIEQLGSAAPEAVPAILAALKEDRQTVPFRLRELWADANGERLKRMRAGMALLADDPALKEPLAAWMIEADDPREVLLVRDVLAPHAAELAPGLWQKVEDLATPIDSRFRALAALALFDPSNPRWKQAAPILIEQLIKVNPLHLGIWIPALRPVRDSLHPSLVEVFQGRRFAEHRLLAARVLADYDAGRPEVLAELARDADGEQFAILRPLLEKNSESARAALKAELAKTPPPNEPEAERVTRAKRQANATVALFVLGEPDTAFSILKHSQTPDVRTALIHGLAPRRADPHVLLPRLLEEKDASIRQGLILALGEFTTEQLSLNDRAALRPTLLAWYHNDPDPGVHAAIDWLLRHDKEGPKDRPINWDCRDDLDRIDAELAGKPCSAGQRWYVNGQGQTFSAVRCPIEFLMGSPVDEPERKGWEVRHLRKIGRSFAMGTKPVTVSQWRKFLQAMKDANIEMKHSYWNDFAPEPGCPIVSVSWYDAAMYCRWLSELENVLPEQMVYPPLKEIRKCGDGRMPLRMPKDYLSRTGYRLPTDAEFECACRAGTVTRWYFGGAEEYLSRYAWFLGNSESHTWPVGQKKPNELGLFDMHGNVWVWCQDAQRVYDPAGMEDLEDDRDVEDSLTRILRGGSFLYRPAILRSAFSENDRPSYPGITVGLRLARTLPADDPTTK